MKQSHFIIIAFAGLLALAAAKPPNPEPPKTRSGGSGATSSKSNKSGYDYTIPSPICAKFEDINVAGIGVFVDTDGSASYTPTTGDMSISFSLTGVSAAGSYPTQTHWREIDLDLNAVCIFKDDNPMNAPVCFYEAQMSFCRPWYIFPMEMTPVKISSDKVFDMEAWLRKDQTVPGRRAQSAIRGGVKAVIAEVAESKPEDRQLKKNMFEEVEKEEDEIVVAEAATEVTVVEETTAVEEEDNEEIVVVEAASEVTAVAKEDTAVEDEEEEEEIVVTKAATAVTVVAEEATAAKKAKKNEVEWIDAVLVDEMLIEWDMEMFELLEGKYVPYNYCTGKREGGFTAAGTGNQGIKITGGTGGLFGAFGQIIAGRINITSTDYNGDIEFNFDAGLEICFYQRESDFWP